VIRPVALLVSFCLAFPLGAVDLAAIQAEPNLAKRAKLALAAADADFKAARETYAQKDDLRATNASLREVSQLVDLAYASLLPAGKNPWRFKDAEIRTRGLLRLLADFRESMSVLDRDEIDQVRAAVEKVHDELLAGIMAGKKK
jgi:hypothetical protein